MNTTVTRFNKLSVVLLFLFLIVACSKKPTSPTQQDGTSASIQPVNITPVIPVVNSVPKPLPPEPKTPEQVLEEADYLAYITVNSVVHPDPEDKNGVTTYSRGIASGILMRAEDNELYILTAAHLYPKAGEVEGAWIRLKHQDYCKNLLEAEFVVYDRILDIAVLKFKEKFEYKGRVASLGVSANLKAGQEVYALGAPNKIPDCVSSGNIQSPFIGIEFLTQHPGLIVHDASVSGGSSGGPLLNKYGEVVGLNIRVYSNKGYMVTHAVPIDDIRHALPALMRIKLELPHMVMYVNLANSWELTPTELKRAKIAQPTKPGLVIVLIPDFFAESYAEFRIGDLILEVNGNKVTDAGHFYHDLMIDPDFPNEAELLIERSGKALKLKATLWPFVK